MKQRTHMFYYLQQTKHHWKNTYPNKIAIIEHFQNGIIRAENYKCYVFQQNSELCIMIRFEKELSKIEHTFVFKKQSAETIYIINDMRKTINQLVKEVNLLKKQNADMQRDISSVKDHNPNWF
jgi:hypothetical protein